MLTYFPTPYPGEWWYSVLCRYHVRSGNPKHATTINELCGGRPMVHGRLVPGGDCAAILSNLPPGVLLLNDVLANHTLLPYYTRFFPMDKKQQVWEALRAGRGSGITSVRTQMPDGTEGLKYCPNCYLLDTQEYGEPFWHRVHQIPLLGYCPMHKIPLVTVPIKFARLSEVFLPLISVYCQRAEHGEIAPWMEPLADMIAALLYGDYTPTVGYNNLHTALINAGCGVDKISEHQALSVAKIQQAAREYYGTQIYEQYFASLSAAVLSRLISWHLSSPERYALLAVMVGLDADRTLFFSRAAQGVDCACRGSKPTVPLVLARNVTSLIYKENVGGWLLLPTRRVTAKTTARCSSAEDSQTALEAASSPCSTGRAPAGPGSVG